MVHGHPVQARAQVAGHAFHQVPGEGAQLLQRAGVLGGHDEAELVAILPAPGLECLEIGAIRHRIVCLAGFALASDALALDVAKVRRDRPPAGLTQVHQPGLDRHPATAWRAAGDESRGDMAAAEAGAGSVRAWAPTATGLAGLAQDLRHQ